MTNNNDWYELMYQTTTRQVNSLWPSDAIWRQRSRSTFAQVMAWGRQATSHYLGKCWPRSTVDLSSVISRTCAWLCLLIAVDTLRLGDSVYKIIDDVDPQKTCYIVKEMPLFREFMDIFFHPFSPLRFQRANVFVRSPQHRDNRGTGWQSPLSSDCKLEIDYVSSWLSSNLMQLICHEGFCSVNHN